MNSGGRKGGREGGREGVREEGGECWGYRTHGSISQVPTVRAWGSEFRFLTPTGRSDVAAYIRNPRDGGADMDKPWGLWTASLGETQGLVRDPVSKK